MNARPAAVARPHVPVQLDGPHTSRLRPRLARTLARCAVAAAIAAALAALVAAAVVTGHAALAAGVV